MRILVLFLQYSRFSSKDNAIMFFDLGYICIQNFHLGRYIVGYTIGNLVFWRRVSGAVKRDFQTYIRRYTSPNENFEYSYPHSNAQVAFLLKNDCENVECCANVQRLSAA